MGSTQFIMSQCTCHSFPDVVSKQFPRFSDRDLFMRYRGGGVGHLTTRHINQVLLSDKHTPFDENTNIPSLVPPEDQASGTEDEGDGDDEDHNDKELAAAIHDTDIITTAGFGAL